MDSSPANKHRPEPTDGRRGGHDPDGDGDGRRHERSQARRKHCGEQRGERPDRGLGPAPVRPSWPRALKRAQEMQEQQQRRVGGGHERDRSRVAPGPVDGDGGVARERAEAYHGQEQEATVATVHSWCGAVPELEQAIVVPGVRYSFQFIPGHK